MLAFELHFRYRPEHCRGTAKARKPGCNDIEAIQVELFKSGVIFA